MRADSSFKTVADYVAVARSLPQGADDGTAGIGSSNHLMVACQQQLSLAACVDLP